MASRQRHPVASISPLAVFACMQCAYTQHADVVAAMNIVRAGYALLEACGEDISHLEPLMGSSCRLVEAGTHRGDQAQLSLDTVGIPALKDGEDVK